MRTLPIYWTDFYKTGHAPQYPRKTEVVYSNLTARDSRLAGVDRVVVWFIQAFLKNTLINDFNKGFFQLPKSKVIEPYRATMSHALGSASPSVANLEELHDLGYLPLRIKALPEGTLCPLRTPILTVRNTDKRFFWLTNFIETMLSAELWHPMTCATIAWEYRKLLHRFALDTGGDLNFVPWQGHDFSMRGQTSVHSATHGGTGHMLSFTGTDTIPVLPFLAKVYNAHADQELVGGSVPATEHSVMCLGEKETEEQTFRRLITEVVPYGVISIVSDTWDYWNVIGRVVPNLKKEILARNGRVVIRPDSGDPVKIICGDPSAPQGSIQQKGTVQALYEIFGGTINKKGFKELNPKIGVIYGDSITLDVARQILTNLKELGFASTNVVFGIGSYTYQHVTRDTFGFAVKATWGMIDGKPVEIFKDPKTDSGIKKSARGLLRVNADLTVSEGVSQLEERDGMLETVFLNGKLMRECSLSDVRHRLLRNLPS